MGKALELKRRLRSPEQTEARILQAAEEVFGVKGYANATVADVVDLAQVSRGAFYLYFDNKDDVFKTLVARVIADLFEVTTRRASGTIRDRVAISTRSYLQAFLRHRPVLRCLFEVSSSDAEMASMHNEFRARFIERIRRHLERNVVAGLCHPMDTRIASYSLGLMVESVGYSWLVSGFEPWPGGFELERVVRQLTDLWCRAAYKDGAADALQERPS
ncbi:MAG: TetR/AcrR family transcriptional regulator [Alphaproteobacteria bacterium]|nr:TetR/AcrR family transcriptional regulator [Alphaproteobacteria bacterium]